jgi:predicted O-methyltransferase YrrM
MHAIRHFWKIAGGCLTHGPGTLKLARKAIYEKRAVQRTWELMSVIGLVKSLGPDTVLEIGTHGGGTLFCWPQVATETALIISVDFPDGPFGGGYEEQDMKRFEGYLRGAQTLKCLRRDSHSWETHQMVLSTIGNRPVDFLFIDGDHTYRGVKADFEMYAPLVRKGGLIAFHDINENPFLPECGVPDFWREIRSGFRAYEFIDQGRDQHGMGIGVLVQSKDYTA